jgi:hypothetical protein
VHVVDPQRQRECDAQEAGLELSQQCDVLSRNT